MIDVETVIEEVRDCAAESIRRGPFTLDEIEDYADLDAALVRQFAQGFIYLDNDQLARLAAVVGPYCLGPDLERVPGSVGSRAATGEGARTRRRRLTSFRPAHLIATDPDLYDGPERCTPEELASLRATAVKCAEVEHHPHLHLPDVLAVRRHAIVQRSQLRSRIFPALDEGHRAGWLVALDPRDVKERFGLTQTQGWLRFHPER